MADHPDDRGRRQGGQRRQGIACEIRHHCRHRHGPRPWRHRHHPRLGRQLAALCFCAESNQPAAPAGDDGRFPGGRRRRDRPRPAALLSRSPLLHRRGRSRSPWPRRPGGDADAARALPRPRRAPCRARRVQSPGLPERQARPRPGRGGGRPDRRRNRQRRSLGDALAAGRVLEGRSWAHRGIDRLAHAGRGNTGFPRGGHRLSEESRRLWPVVAAAIQAYRSLRSRPPGQVAAIRTACRARRPAQCRQVFAAQPVGRGRSGHRHAGCRDDARCAAVDHPDRGNSVAHHRYRRAARDRR